MMAARNRAWRVGGDVGTDQRREIMTAPSYIATYSDLILRPDPSRTVIRPFAPDDPAAFAVADHPRAQRIVDRVLAFDETQLVTSLARLEAALANRHRNIDELLLRRFDEIKRLSVDRATLSRDHALLIGAYFSEEYSFEAAALFNPSLVAHPDQTGVAPGAIRFVMSLRGIGEGHVSSVTFRTGIWSPDTGFAIDTPSDQAVPPRVDQPETLTDDSVIHLLCDGSRDVSETVLFPMVPRQRQGIEDVRLVRFVEDDGAVRYYGTFTAFSGAVARSELLETRDFHSFTMRPLRGPVADSKGMALFPRRLDGRYAMLGRQDNENIWFQTSDDLTHWDNGTKIVAPLWPWEAIQMGNCGSPIEIDEGWLVLTHGVGMVRSYCIGACLLDKEDPTRLLARLPRPMIHPSPSARDGYVPNVVYSCGGLVQDRTLLLPYGVADNYAAFAEIEVDALLAAMQ
jgi:predicted GH43/DUF377 family glycosyl hydrolase